MNQRDDRVLDRILIDRPSDDLSGMGTWREGPGELTRALGLQPPLLLAELDRIFFDLDVLRDSLPPSSRDAVRVSFSE